MIAAVIVPVTADISSDDSILNCWVSTMNPQWDVSATAIFPNTSVWDLNIQAIKEETIPVSQSEGVTLAMVRLSVSGSPWIIQHNVVVAGVNRMIIC